VTSIKELMQKHIVAVSKSTTLDAAVKLMKQAHVSVVPVVDDGALSGILTLKEAECEGPSRKVGELNLRFIFVEQNDKPEKAASLMVSHKLNRLPVVSGSEGMRCVGIVTSTDIARHHKKG